MECVLLKLFQENANYRIENCYGYVQTYPLPTPSMIRGMVHSVLGIKEYKDLQISIQGTSSGINASLNTCYKFDVNKTSITVDGKNVQKSTHKVEMVNEINLIIHVLFKDKNLNELLIDRIKEKTISIGRHEDICRVDDVSMVKYKNISIEDSNIDILNKKIYIGKSDLFNYKMDTSCSIVRMPFKYNVCNGVRLFEFIEATYIDGQNNSILLDSDAKCIIDENENILSFLGITNE